MIIVRLMGGIGNQMFQYAFGRYLACLNGSELKLDLSFLNGPPKGVTKRGYELGIYNIAAGIADAEELKKITGKGILATILSVSGKITFKNIEEPSFEFHPEMLKLTGDIYLRGYWQSEKYFKGIDGLIKRDFSFKEDPDEENKKLLDKISSSCSVGVHVRRGDYASDPATKGFHGLCDPDYYRKAAELMNDRCTDPVYFVFSDDIKWARENIRFPGSVIYVDNNQGRSGEDMRLFSRCKHNVTANSSFSWWGAWLNNDPDKIVVAPRRWFADESRNAITKDLIPESWVRL